MSPNLIISLSIAVSSFCSGWIIQGYRLNSEITRIEAAWHQENKDSAEAASQIAEEVIRIEREGERLAARALELETEANRMGKEKDDVLRKITSGRLCLTADIVRLLNDHDAARTAGSALSAPARDIAHAHATTTADPDVGRFATDGDIALWARNAKTQYDACRGRIDALRRFDESSNSP
ncbi:MAG: hypothetical protein FWC58_06860 [Desulfobulbus sp.]|nr:hypothetical protein [Desulfobulbus sp.]